ncbi:uncharacterized protein LOC126726294 [Quercus robur]|uniref:uncharacterized protein LOC126726294 n=1 Tax=Quercus robur TaxID=38942 RepID=UPI002161CCB1|nr:uncharacterized protein LOC126726294 [Quercus robur]
MQVPSTVKAPSTSQSSPQAPQYLIGNEDLAWERFRMAVTDADVSACYNMSLKDFEHSGVHDLFKAMSKFIAASRQATDLDKTRVLLEKRIKEVKDESKRWAEAAAKANEGAKELQNQIEELKTDVVEKETRLDHLQKKNDELNDLLKKAKEDAVVEFKASKQFTDLWIPTMQLGLRTSGWTPWRTSPTLISVPSSSILVVLLPVPSSRQAQKMLI